MSQQQLDIYICKSILYKGFKISKLKKKQSNNANRNWYKYIFYNELHIYIFLFLNKTSLPCTGSGQSLRTVFYMTNGKLLSGTNAIQVGKSTIRDPWAGKRKMKSFHVFNQVSQLYKQRIDKKVFIIMLTLLMLNTDNSFTISTLLSLHATNDNYSHLVNY